MPEWTCTGCATVLRFEEVDQKKVIGKHCKACVHRQKTAGTWPVPAIAGTFCCPFRYRGCRFSNQIDRVRKHYAKSVECPGPGTGDTPMTIYGPAASLSSQELGKFVEASYPAEGLTPIVKTVDYRPRAANAPIATSLSSALPPTQPKSASPPTEPKPPLPPTKPNTPDVLVAERVLTDHAAPLEGGVCIEISSAQAAVLLDDTVVSDDQGDPVPLDDMIVPLDDPVSSPAPTADLVPLDSSALLDNSQGNHGPVGDAVPLVDPITVAVQKADNKRKETASSSETDGKGVQKRIKLNATPTYRVHCPSASLRAHFKEKKEKKEKGSLNQWHVYSFSFTPAWGNRNIRIYREEDLRFWWTGMAKIDPSLVGPGGSYRLICVRLGLQILDIESFD
ncbi:uncharacterized protein F5147DRAFT_657714 [Suillus discolor]|uniref:Uncharacterized protein n=1 Tax=Suillus discolor TaxID=1912936 RepID=A0A9P7EWE4_9AGAM|nr:uncharacterized protein F5147DRAFT_657714 [Suillus discolor]KAG2092305.1 hypothetical protein F5147DRAFT_657714 [Suillus discolor]